MAACYGCDTFICLPPASTGAVLFAKNSDRHHDEVQEIVVIPSSSCTQDTVKCTYIEIDQVTDVKSVILSKPSWMWGAEMGANDCGVVIGNEAVWTNQPDDGIEKLTGMDLVRLGLERSTSARQAVDVIADLLDKYGQGGPCSEDDPSMTYHNSFMMADRTEGWVLETAGTKWVAKRIERGVCNISNCLSIGTDYDLRSCNVDDGVDFNNLFCATGPCDRFRNGRNLMLQLQKKGDIGVREMIKILRNKQSGICMDRNGGFVSTSSQVSILPFDPNVECIHFFTGTPDPSISMFKPFVFCNEPDSADNVVSPTHTDDPAKIIPRFQTKVDRQHNLYKMHAMAFDGKHPNRTPKQFSQLICEIEDLCLSELLEKLHNKQNINNVQSLFKDCVDAELNLYSF